MKTKIFSVIAGLLLTASVFAQAPQKMSYQAVIRNSSSALVTSTSVGMKISILQGTSTGTAVYVETQTPTTNANGLVSLEIGSGTPVTGTFSGINWATGLYFIKTETDPTGGTAYTIVGTNKLMSVPYALYAAKTAPLTCLTNVDCPSGFVCSGGGCVPSFTHYLGEAYLGGIIYYLYKGSDGLEHGLIVALTESTAQWQTSSTLVNANRTEDGAFNTALMTGSPAATYIAGLGAGWYLPSVDELGLLYYNRYSAQKGLRAGGNTLISNTGNYWSSTENGATIAYIFNFYYDSANLFPKTSTATVRGVRAF
ncbi:hypothetical protein [Flavobacterium sp.]|uniref:hypothetical protein n=1 Tax=Flavobacterium sp. TaxID=239 RepID=UPI0033403BEF